MKSVLHLSESVDNKDRRFGAADEYFPIRIVDEDGNSIDALFTYDQLAVAIRRATRNKEDIPEKSLWEKIFG